MNSFSTPMHVKVSGSNVSRPAFSSVVTWLSLLVMLLGLTVSATAEAPIQALLPARFSTQPARLCREQR